MSADRELYNFVREIENVEDDIRDRNRAKSDVYKEAGARGYDKKTLRKVVAARRLDPVEREEQDHTFDLYMIAVERAEKGIAHAHVEKITEFRPSTAKGRGAGEGLTGTPHDPETGELIETSEAAIVPPTATEQPETASSSIAVSGAHSDQPQTGESDAKSALPPPVEAPDLIVGAGLDAQEAERQPLAETQLDTTPAGSVADEIPVLHPNPAHDLPSSQGEPATGDGALVAASPSSSEPFEPPVFLRKTAADYRTHCQNREECAGVGLKHCHTCQKIADAAMEAA